MENKIGNTKLIFYGGVGTATGANIMLQTDKLKTLVDCGLLQGLPGDEKKNLQPFKYNPAEVDYLLITHAHMDHIGKIGKLVKDGFRGKIISTLATMEIAKPSLADAYKIMLSRDPNNLMYGLQDIEKAFSLWSSYNYHEEIKLSEDCTLEMQNAGHILGSAIMNIKVGGEHFVFTGDLGNSPSPLLPDVEIPKGANYIVMESVYGDRNHTERQERVEDLKRAILDGVKRGGPIIIPSFSIERTQVLLYELNELIEGSMLPQIHVYLDSPLAEKVTEIYKNHEADFNESVKEDIRKGDNIFDFPKLEIISTHNKSIEIEREPNPKIILAGSGMSSGGRVVNHEMHFLSDPKATIIITGYQAAGTLGRQLQEGVKEIEITHPNPSLKLREGQKLRVNAKIESVLGFSSHADSDHLLEFVEKSAESGKLKNVFCIMGEPKSSLFLVQRIRDYLGVEAIYPEENKPYEL